MECSLRYKMRTISNTYFHSLLRACKGRFISGLLSTRKVERSDNRKHICICRLPRYWRREVWGINNTTPNGRFISNALLSCYWKFQPSTAYDRESTGSVAFAANVHVTISFPGFSLPSSQVPIIIDSNRYQSSMNFDFRYQSIEIDKEKK